MSEILAGSGEKPKGVHLILYDSENDIPSPPEIINEPALSARYEIEAIHSLTRCEKAILESLADGLKYRDIAKKHYLSTHTVKCHVSNIYKKHGINAGKMKITTSVDLREWCSPIENQGKLGSCTAHAGILFEFPFANFQRIIDNRLYLPAYVIILSLNEPKNKKENSSSSFSLLEPKKICGLQ